MHGTPYTLHGTQHYTFAQNNKPGHASTHAELEDLASGILQRHLVESSKTGMSIEPYNFDYNSDIVRPDYLFDNTDLVFSSILADLNLVYFDYQDYLGPNNWQMIKN